MSGTAVEHNKLVVYYPSKDAQEAKKSIVKLRTIIAQEYKQRGSKKTTALLDVRNPEARLITPAYLRWSLVDWFKDKTYRLPGIVGMDNWPNGIVYIYNKQDESAV